MRRGMLAVVVGLLAGGAVSADIPGGKSQPPPIPPHTPLPPLPPQLLAEGKPLVISDDSPDGRVHVLIPRKLQPVQLQVRPSSLLPDGAVSRTIVAGLFLSVAMVTGGLWLLRRRQAPKRFGKLALAGTLLVASFGCMLWDNVIRPTPTVAPPEPIPGAVASGYVAVEYVNEGDAITIKLPKEMAAKVRDDSGKETRP